MKTGKLIEMLLKENPRPTDAGIIAIVRGIVGSSHFGQKSLNFYKWRLRKLGYVIAPNTGSPDKVIDQNHPERTKKAVQAIDLAGGLPEYRSYVKVDCSVNPVGLE